MMIWIYDENNILIGSDFYMPAYDEDGNEIEPDFKYTTVPPMSNTTTGTIPYRPRFDESTQTWVEDMTEEEIKEWKEANKHEPEQPNKLEVLEKKVAELEEEKNLLQKENKLLHAQVEVLGATTDFHEELITEMAMKVYA